MEEGADKGIRRTPVWDWFWIRLPAYLFCTPFVILAVDVVMAVLLYLAFDDISEVLSNMPSITIWALVQMVPLIVPLILVELGNRRRGSAVPPGLCALFVSAFSVALTGTIAGVGLMIIRIPQSYRYTSGTAFTVLFILSSCIVAGAISWALTAPLIRRWAVRNASAGNMAEHF